TATTNAAPIYAIRRIFFLRFTSGRSMSTETTSHTYISQIAFRRVTTYKAFIILLLGGLCKRRFFPLARSWEYFVPQPNTISTQFGPAGHDCLPPLASIRPFPYWREFPATASAASSRRAPSSAAGSTSESPQRTRHPR